MKYGIIDLLDMQTSDIDRAYDEGDISPVTDTAWHWLWNFNLGQKDEMIPDNLSIQATVLVLSQTQAIRDYGRADSPSHNEVLRVLDEANFYGDLGGLQSSDRPHQTFAELMAVIHDS